MNINVLDENFNVVAVLDTYQSFIWTDRYDTCGDFELYQAMDRHVLNYLIPGYYLTNKDSDRLMIIESLKTDTNVEQGNTLTVKGRSLESILDRRIIWKQTIISGNLQDAIEKLLNENVIDKALAGEDRIIPNFIFVKSTDEAITKLTIETTQFTGDNLYEVITKMCSSVNIGFRVRLTSDNKFAFELFAGKDRSYNQTVNPYVVYSPSFDNLISSDYISDWSVYKNVTRVGGEGDGLDRRYVTVGTITGLARREIFTDARDISSTDENGNTISKTNYETLLKQRGTENLNDNPIDSLFDGEVDNNGMYKYGRDYSIGDIVQLSNEYGMNYAARITEIVTSDDEKGFSFYPTFDIVQGKEESN